VCNVAFKFCTTHSRRGERSVYTHPLRGFKHTGKNSTICGESGVRINAYVIYICQ
jgi:hypothetical protein